MVDGTAQRIVKAARALLGWSQTDLADNSGVSLSSIARFEAGAGLGIDSMVKIRQAFERGGLNFIFRRDDVIGLKFSTQTKGAKKSHAHSV